MCGKYVRVGLTKICLPGSPPRVREVSVFFRVVYQTLRITPACAGSMKGMIKELSVIWDHPRVCGKYSSARSGEIARAGSPPRVREVFTSIILLTIFSGITPACAGSINYRLPRLTISEDHPRVCGKYKWTTPFVPFFMGSPPRVREVFLFFQ